MLVRRLATGTFPLFESSSLLGSSLFGGDPFEAFAPLFRSLQSLTEEARPGGGQVSARVEDDRVVFELVVPGLDPETELAVEVDGSVLTVSGGRERKDGEKRFAVSKFSRRWDLGFDIDPERVTAAYEAGVLTVDVRRPEETKSEAHRIKIVTAEK